MSDSTNPMGNFGSFGKLVPGFDFLQNLAKGAGTGIPQMPNLGNWVAPTLNVEELEKRIEELKAVHFWLEQNSRALGATIQALEVQKMTLATLQSMNLDMSAMSKAFQFPAASISSFANAAAPASAPSAPPPAPPTVVEPSKPAAKKTTSAKRSSASGISTEVSGSG